MLCRLRVDGGCSLTLSRPGSVVCSYSYMYAICEGSVEATMAEQLELASNDDLTLLSSEILTSPMAQTEGCFNASFAADSVDDIVTCREK